MVRRSCYCGWWVSMNKEEDGGGRAVGERGGAKGRDGKRRKRGKVSKEGRVNEPR